MYLLYSLVYGKETEIETINVFSFPERGKRERFMFTWYVTVFNCGHRNTERLV